MGMLPLVIAPGAGSVIYKGLATVIVGGMAISTLFTLILLPCLLRLEPLSLKGSLARRAHAIRLKINEPS